VQQRRERRRPSKRCRPPHGLQQSCTGAEQHVGAGAQHDVVGAQHDELGVPQWSPVPLIASSKTRLCMVVSSKVDIILGTTSSLSLAPSARVPNEGHRLGHVNLGVIMGRDDPMSRQIEEFGQIEAISLRLAVMPFASAGRKK